MVFAFSSTCEWDGESIQYLLKLVQVEMCSFFKEVCACVGIEVRLLSDEVSQLVLEVDDDGVIPSFPAELSCLAWFGERGLPKPIDDFRLSNMPV